MVGKSWISKKWSQGNWLFIWKNSRYLLSPYIKIFIYYEIQLYWKVECKEQNLVIQEFCRRLFLKPWSRKEFLKLTPGYSLEYIYIYPRNWYIYPGSHVPLCSFSMNYISKLLETNVCLVKWLNKICCSHTVEYSLVVKYNKLNLH